MTARADLALVKHLDAGDSVSYGHQWTAPGPTTVGLVPVGPGVHHHTSAGGGRREGSPRNGPERLPL